MRDDDDALSNIDLSNIDLAAWEPPAPPASLVDDVMARVTASGIPALVEPGEPAPRRAHVGHAKRWWLAGGIAAAVAAVAAFGVWGLERAPSRTSHGAETPVVEHAPSRTSHVAEAPVVENTSRVSGGPSEVDDTNVGGGPSKVQSSNPDVAVAEAELHRAQVVLDNQRRLFAADASTQANVDLAQAEVDIAKIALDRARGTSPPVPAEVAQAEAKLRRAQVKLATNRRLLAVQASTQRDVDLAQADVEIANVALERARLQAQQPAAPAPVPADAAERLRRDKARSPEPLGCDEVSCVLTDGEGACCAKYRRTSKRVEDAEVALAEAEVRSAKLKLERTLKLAQAQAATQGDVAKARADLEVAEAKLRQVREVQLPDGLDRNAIEKVIDSIKPQIQACGGNFTGMMKLAITVAASGDVSKSWVTGPDGIDKPADVAACIHGAALNLTFPRTRNGGSFTYPFVFEAKPACNAAFLVEKGNALANAGMWPTALAKFEEALACAPSDATIKRVFAAACNAKLADKAKLYYGKLPADVRPQLAPLCTRNGITLDGAAR